MALSLVKQSYIELVDITGRIIREGKKGSINTALPPILDRLNINIEAWLIRTQSFGPPRVGVMLKLQEKISVKNSIKSSLRNIG